MKKYQILLNKKGFSLIETMIAAGVLLAIMLSASSVIINMQRSTASDGSRRGASVLQLDLNSVLQSSTVCTQSIAKNNLDLAAVTTASGAPVSITLADATVVRDNTDLPDYNLRVSALRVANATVTPSGTDKIITGSLVFDPAFSKVENAPGMSRRAAGQIAIVVNSANQIQSCSSPGAIPTASACSAVGSCPAAPDGTYCGGATNGFNGSCGGLSIGYTCTNGRWLVTSVNEGPSCAGSYGPQSGGDNGGGGGGGGGDSGQ